MSATNKNGKVCLATSSPSRHAVCVPTVSGLRDNVHTIAHIKVPTRKTIKFFWASDACFAQRDVENRKSSTSRCFSFSYYIILYCAYSTHIWRPHAPSEDSEVKNRINFHFIYGLYQEDYTLGLKRISIRLHFFSIFRFRFFRISFSHVR